MKSLVVLTAIATLTLSGCATTHVSQPSSPIQSKVEAPLRADLSIGNKIYGSAKNIQILGLFNFGPSKFADGVNYGAGSEVSMFDKYAPVKAAAAYEATTKTKADVIIAPKYTVETKDYFLFNITTAKVDGFKGSLNGVSK
jgi:uncharacterized protein YceK